MLTAKSVHMALSGAPCVFTWLRYFGNQPSRPPLVQRARGTSHGRHDRQDQGEEQQHDQDLGDELAAFNHAGQGPAHVRSGIDTGIEHALRAQYALEDDGDEGVGGDAEQTGVDDGPPHVLARVLELAHVADGRFEGVGRPGRDEKTAEKEQPPALVPDSRHDGAAGVLGKRRERQEVSEYDVAGQQRHDAYDEKGQQRRHRQNSLDARGAKYAAMLDREHDQHDDRANDERGVDPQRQAILEETQIDERDLPRVDGRIRGVEDRQEIAGAETGADRQHRRPGQPVGP